MRAEPRVVILSFLFFFALLYPFAWILEPLFKKRNSFIFVLFCFGGKNVGGATFRVFLLQLGRNILNRLFWRGVFTLTKAFHQQGGHSHTLQAKVPPPFFLSQLWLITLVNNPHRVAEVEAHDGVWHAVIPELQGPVRGARQEDPGVEGVPSEIDNFRPGKRWRMFLPAF